MCKPCVYWHTYVHVYGISPILAISYYSSVFFIDLSPSVPMFLLLSQSSWLTCVHGTVLIRQELRMDSVILILDAPFFGFTLCLSQIQKPPQEEACVPLCAPHPPWSC